MEERVEIHVQVTPPRGRHRRIDPRTRTRRVLDALARWLRLSDGGTAVVLGLAMGTAASLAVAIITAMPLV